VSTPRIVGLRVQNFRVLRDARLEALDPLTVVAGPNGEREVDPVRFDAFAFPADPLSPGLPIRLP